MTNPDVKPGLRSYETRIPMCIPDMYRDRRDR